MQKLCSRLFGLLFFSLPATSLMAERQWRQITNDAFGPGEVIVYEINYGAMTAGQASLEVHNIDVVEGRNAYHIISKARTNKLIDQIFMVRDSNDSWIDMESICSVQFMQNVHEGRYRKWSLTRLDQTKGRFSYQKKGKGKDDFVEGEIPPDTQDILSSIYYLRTLEMNQGAEHVIHVNSGGTNWPLKVVVHASETVAVPAGKFDCQRVEPILSGEGLFQAKGRVEVWFTRDKFKIPVLLRSKVAVGSFEAEMKEYSVSGKSLSDLKKEP